MGELVLRYADLSPPLGAAGGPCRVVNRIMDERLPDRLEEELVGLVDANLDLSNQQANRIYEPIREKGPHPFSQFVLTPHSQYRMDLRGITVRDLRESLSRFVTQVEEWKRKNDPRYRQLLDSRQKLEWVDAKSGLFFVFAFGSQNGVPTLVTTYWKGRPTPEMPAQGCQIRSADYRAPAGDLAGVRTVVEEKPAKGIPDKSLGDSIEHIPGESWRSDRERTSPQLPDNTNDLTKHPPGPPVYNTPGPATKGEPASPIPKSKIKMRTPSTPGEEYGHPYKENIYPRRTAEEHEAAGAGTFPTWKQRQHKQKGKAKLYYKKWYRRHKSEIRTRARRRYRKERVSPTFKRKKHLRNTPKYHNRFRRLPFGGSRTLSERAERGREKAASLFPMSFYHTRLGWGDVLDFEPDGILVHLDGESEETALISLRAFLKGVVFETDEDSDAFFEAMEAAYEDETPDVRWIAATFYREVYRKPDNLDPGPGGQDFGLPSQFNPNEDLDYPNTYHDQESRPSGHKLDVRQMDQAPGSAKVIPSGHDFANKEASIRVAKRLAELLGETSTDVLKRSKTIRPKGRRFDPKTGMYSFRVLGSSGNNYTVRMKVSGRGNVTKLALMDLKVSCDCDFWQWQGPEHWAKVEDYLYGTPRGTASKPDIKDPRSIHKVCKHVAACLEMVKKWELPKAR